MCGSPTADRATSTIESVRRIRAGERRVAVSVVSLALFGLFAMHGWGVHGSGHEIFTSHASPAAQACDAPAAHHCPPDPAQSSGDHGLMGLCLAILTGAAFAAIAMLSLQLVRFAGPTERLRHELVPRWVRERDPPDLLALGVIRC